MSGCKCGAKIEYNCICWQEQDVLRRELEAINTLNDLRRELNQAIKERDKARECLREAICYRDSSMSGYDLEEWREAAGEGKQ